MSDPRIEVKVEWDRDAGGDLTVYVDGVPTDAVVEWIDPGRGYELSGWREHTEWVLLNESLTPRFRDAVVAAREQGEDSQYVADDIEWAEIARDEGDEPPARWRVSYWCGDIKTLADDEVHTDLSMSRAGNDAKGAWLIRHGYTNVHLEEWDPEVDQGPLNRGWALYGHIESEDQT